MVILLILFFSLNLHAQSVGQVTVLEAPIFKNDDINSKVIQYLYRGNQVYIHSNHTRKDKFKEINDISEDQLEKSHKEYQKDFKDPLFESQNAETLNSKFYKTQDKNGNDAFILKDHVFVFYKDNREMDQSIASFDPTDYRLEEPLPIGYPLIINKKKRGIISLAFRSALRHNYPFSEPINDQALGLESEFNFIWSNHVDWDEEVRLFFGGNLSLSNGENSFITETSSATENLFRISIGPYLGYDIWRNDKFRFNIFSALNFGLINSKSVRISKTASSDRLNLDYTTNDIELRFGSNFQIQDILKNADFLIGFNTFLQLPKKYELKSQSGEINNFSPSFIKSNFNETYLFGMNLFFGLQNDF